MSFQTWIVGQPRPSKEGSICSFYWSVVGSQSLMAKTDRAKSTSEPPRLRLAMNPTLKEAEHNACFTALPALLSDRRIGVKYATGHSFWGEWKEELFCRWQWHYWSVYSLVPIPEPSLVSRSGLKWRISTKTNNQWKIQMTDACWIPVEHKYALSMCACVLWQWVRHVLGILKILSSPRWIHTVHIV